MWEVLTSFDPALLAAFVAAGLLLNLTPGVDFVYITGSGLSGGPRIGMAAATGVCLGVGVHVLAAAGGVSALLLAYPAAYGAVRLAGAAWLGWLAVRAWRAGAAPPQRAEGGRSAAQAIARGFLTNVLNPKTALFIFAFVPQFTDPATGPVWVQIVLLGAVFMVNSLLFTLALGAGAGWLASGLSARAGLINKITAIVFGGLAARLILD